ncbi:MAG: tRNA epoxyqueuosine(34) reductase QueG [Pseudomonadota bacterium]
MEGLIKKAAAEVGFASVGITSAYPVEGLLHLNDAIDSGRTAAMGWLTRDPRARCEPSSLLSGARSVICCALAYGEHGIALDNPPKLAPSPLGGEGRGEGGLRARFARGADYHDVVRKKLGLLWEAVRRAAPGARANICVDTSPILEKALAARAGLGWIGKHTILLNQELGSWFMLGEIITDLELEPDASAADRCAGCRACIEACPRGAFTAPRSLDARKCISYLTIERGEEGDAYGCDACQDACPYNTLACHLQPGTHLVAAD